MEATTTLWKRLWEFDPNGLLVLDEQMKIVLVNPALCRMFKTGADVEEFRRALDERRKITGVEREYPRYDLYVRKVIFPIPDERIVAGIFVDLTTEWRHEQELHRLKQEAIAEVRQVVDKQMRVAQEIAGLLGETTAETKVSLLRLLDMLGREKPQP